MKLVHYSEKPLTELHNNHSADHGAYKPRGFWVSVEGDGHFGWRDWCEQEEWGVDGLIYGHEIVLVDPVRALRVSNEAELRAFHALWVAGRAYGQVNWPGLSSRYAGLIIAPYIWECRLEYPWYYGWDCASGVFWDTSCLKLGSVTRVKAPEASER